MINEFKTQGAFYNAWGLAFVLIFLFLFQLVFAFAALVATGIGYGMSITEVQGILSTPDGSAKAINIARITNIISFVGAMALPPLFFSIINKTGALVEGGFKIVPTLPKIFLAILITALSLPLVDFLTSAMHQIHFPHWLEYQALRLEQSREGMMATILDMQRPLELAVCLLILGLMPAVLEEFLFRGVLLNILKKITAKKWTAIFIQAAIFALLHFSFYELPGILLMGIVFGFIAFITGTIWYGIIMHFCFNATAVVFSWLNQRAFESTGVDGKFDNIQFSPLLAIAAAAGLIMILGLWQREAKKEVENANI